MLVNKTGSYFLFYDPVWMKKKKEKKSAMTNWTTKNNQAKTSTQGR